MGREEQKDTEHVPYGFVETPILVEPYIEKGVKVIDWEQRRYEIAMHILPQTLGLGNPEMLAINAVNHADALIEELKKKRTEQ